MRLIFFIISRLIRFGKANLINKHENAKDLKENSLNSAVNLHFIDFNEKYLTKK